MVKLDSKKTSQKIADWNCKPAFNKRLEKHSFCNLLEGLCMSFGWLPLDNCPRLQMMMTHKRRDFSF